MESEEFNSGIIVVNNGIIYINSGIIVVNNNGNTTMITKDGPN